jgi:hypothetical protein
MRPVVRFGRLALLLALALPLACVNPFKPADPESGNSTGVAEDFHTPDAVLETMRLAIENKSEGGTNAWLHAFAESTQVGDLAYRAFYDGAVKQVWEAGKSLKAPEPWDLSYERGLPSKIFRFRPQAVYAFQWDRDLSQNDEGTTGDTAQFHRQYTLVATEGSISSVIANGFADLTFQRAKVGARWSIFRWYDRVNPAVGVNPASDEHTMSWWRMESIVP